MKNFKKALALLIVLLMLVFAVSCTNDKKDTSDDVPDSSLPTPSVSSEPSVSVVSPSLDVVSQLSPDVIPWD